MPKTWTKEKVKLADVTVMAENPRTIKDVNKAALQKSMEQFGYVEPIVWNRTTGHVIGGHQRYSVLVDAGVVEATMVVVELSVEDEMAASITLNNPEIEGEWSELASDLMSQVSGAAPELAASLRIGELKAFVESMKPRGLDSSFGSKAGEIDVDKMAREFDTKCPCCGFAWRADGRDVSTEGENGA